jgi:hypothetical protein
MAARNSKTRGEVRLILSRAIEGDRFHPIVDAVPSATGGTTTTLVDSKYAAGIYQDDHFVNWELVNQTQGFRTFVTDYANATSTWTFPVTTASQSGDVYECHNRAGPLSTNYDDALDLAVQATIRNGALTDKVDYSLALQSGREFYPVPSGFSFGHGLLVDTRGSYLARHRPNTFDVLTPLRDTSSSTRLAQAFQMRVSNPTALLGDVYLMLGQVGSIGSGTITLSVQTDANGSPSGTAIATSAAITAADLPAEPTFQRFTFAARPTLTTDTTYWLVLSGTYAINGSAYAVLAADTDAGYSDGDAMVFDGVSWTAADLDLVFTVRAQGHGEYLNLRPRKHFDALNDSTRYLRLTREGLSLVSAYDGHPMILLGQGAASLPSADSDVLEIPYDYAVARAGLHLIDQNPDWVGPNAPARAATWAKIVADLEIKMSTGVYPGAVRFEAL